MTALLDGPLSEANLHAFLDSVEPVLTTGLATDPYPTVANPAAQLDELRAWVSERIPIVRAQVAANASPPPR
jgi:hypothetical protein